MNKKQKLNQSGLGHILLFLLIIVVAFVCFAAFKVVTDRNKPKGNHDLGSNSSTDPVAKGRALSNGQCSGEGSSQLTHAPMDVKDVSTIDPMGLMLGGHVTPVDHEYYYQKNLQAPKDTYPVYADGDGTITAVQFDGNNAWWVTISHSCTFMTNYNLMTSITPDIKAKLPAAWGPNSNGDVNIPVKSGQLIGHVGGQSLDYQVWDTTKTLPGLLYPTAYNNREPWKIHTVEPLNYFSDSVKAQILPLYSRKAAPRDGKIDYDVSGQAVGNWFADGTNGYAGNGSQKEYYGGHLAFAYDSIDPSVLILSTGDYNSKPAQFTASNVDWTKITPTSGVAKVQLKIYGTPKGTALIQMTGKDNLKIEFFPDQVPAQVTGFGANAKTYNRGQDAKMVESTTASH